MKKVLIASVLFMFAFNLNTNAQTAQDKRIRVVAVFAHPDDADSKMGGTAALLAKMGVAVKFVALTNGDAGHHHGYLIQHTHRYHIF